MLRFTLAVSFFAIFSASLNAGFEVLAEGFISLTQHKNSRNTLRLEGAVSMDKPGSPTFSDDSTLRASGAGVVASSPFEVTDLRDAISSTRDVVYDSDGDRSVVDTNIFQAASAGGGGGGCLLR